MGPARKQVIIDTDPGIDDAVAILFALAEPRLEVLGLTPVGGNSSLENTVTNSLRMLDLAGRMDIPVCPGADRSLIDDSPRLAVDSYADLGLGEADLFEPSRPANDEHAVDFIARMAGEAAEPITLIAIGPLTNIALLVAKFPDIPQRIAEVIVMGGGLEGNVTPAAEFNIWCDPEAAQRVLESGLPLTFVGLDVTHQANLVPADLETIAAMGTVGLTLAKMLETYDAAHQALYGSRSLPMHDALAVAHAIDQNILELDHVRLDVDCEFSISRGATVIDRWGISGAPKNAHYARSVQSEAFHDLLMRNLSKFSGVA
jgi:pyrimidine-specific ribonucleoside hydrolase